MFLYWVQAVGQDCSQPCSCAEGVPQCLMGTSLVVDGCGCCRVCARQMGEHCSLQEPCDHHKDLYCHYSGLSSTRTGVCMARDGQTCDLGGVVYRSGETFQPSCKHQCICMNGEIGCVPTCTPDIQLPSPHCPAPQRITIPGQCCEEWVCGPTPPDQTFQPAMASVSTEIYRELGEQWAESESVRDNCVVQTTEWTECSSSCGMGISTRVTNDNQQCQLEKQSRVCLIRPCHAPQDSAIK
ncbi:hypothetical protein JZ751_016893, partial [Albula glossodonta]